jgi:uncharacterized protein (TIGR00730 family)
MPKRVCVFCGSNLGTEPAYASDARALAAALRAAGLGLVFGGGGTGLMRVLAEAFQAHGGRAIGVVPNALINTENAFERLDERYVVNSYHERKMLMYHLADAFVALPGGPGTLEELLEHLTWMHRGRVFKPVYLINTDGYWNGLITMFNKMRDQGFIADQMTERCAIFSSSPEAVDDFVARTDGNIQ